MKTVMSAPAGAVGRPSAALVPLPWLNPQTLLDSARQSLGGVLSLPFDALRAQYGSAVALGLLPRSMLASREVERALDRLEHMALGPFARNT